MTDFFRKQGRSLLANGYLIVPIRPGRKAPVMSEWQRSRLGAEDLPRYPHHGVGVITGQGAHPICAIDIDSPNAELSKAFQDWCLTNIGITGVRQGQAPKVLLVYRAEHAGWGKASSAIYDDMFDGKCQLEVLGDGQQFVAYHIHPDTKQPYEWLDDRGGIENLAATDLPIIREEQVYDAIRMFEQMAEGYGLTRRSAGCGTLIPEKRERTAPDDDDYFGRVNAAAMERLDQWVPALFPSARIHSGGYRISPVDLGRDTEEDLAIHPKGIKDFGIYDTGDERGGKRTPLDVVMEWGIHASISIGEISAMEAAQWLCEQMSTTPEAMGWGLRRKRERLAGMEAKRKALLGIREAIQAAEDSVTLREEVGPQLRTVLELHQDLYSEVAGLFNTRHKQLTGVGLVAAEQRKLLAPVRVHHTPTSHPLTEFGNAARMIDRHAQSLMYVPELDYWYAWQENHWEVVPHVFIENLAKQTVFAMLKEVDTSDPEKGEALMRWAMASQTAHQVRAMLSIARSDPRVVVPSKELDKNPHLLGVRNGVVDLRTGELLAADPSYRITRVCDASYSPAAPAYWFERTLSEAMWGDQEMCDFIQTAVGYSLMARPKEDVLFIPWGLGANGKSAIFDDGVLNMLGQYGAKADAGTFVENENSKGASGGGPREDLVRLRGSRFVYVGETGQQDRLRESDIKTLSGGDRIVARLPYGRASVEFYPSWVSFMPTNHKPIIRGDDYGIWRRIVPIHFSRNFKSDPDLPHDNQRKEKIRTEADGVLRWAVQGCLMYQKAGLTLPQKVVMDQAAYRESQDVLAQWIDQCCEVGQGLEDSLQNLWISWENFANVLGNRNIVKSSVSLSRRLDSRFTSRRGAKGVRIIQGIRVLNEFGQNP